MFRRILVSICMVTAIIVLGAIVMVVVFQHSKSAPPCEALKPELLWTDDGTLEASWESCWPGHGSVWIEDHRMVDAILREKFGCVFEDHLQVGKTLKDAFQQYRCTFIVNGRDVSLTRDNETYRVCLDTKSDGTSFVSCLIKYELESTRQHRLRLNVLSRGENRSLISVRTSYDCTVYRCPEDDVATPLIPV